MGLPLGQDDRADFEKFAKAATEGLLPKMQNSAIIATLITGSIDVEFALQIGYSILLDKPILAIKLPGAEVPPKLALVADKIVEMDMSTPEGQAAFNVALGEFLDEQGLPREEVPDEDTDDD